MTECIKFELFGELRAAVNLLSRGLCPNCGEKMKMQIDPITKKLSKYLWRCECMPKGMMFSIG